jgi:hypothetical protein
MDDDDGVVGKSPPADHARRESTAVKHLVIAASAIILPAGAPASGQPVAPSAGSPYCAEVPVILRPCTLLSVSRADARAMLESRGYRDVRDLEAVGSYWQGRADTGSGEVTVYVFNDGRVLQAPPPIGEP